MRTKLLFLGTAFLFNYFLFAQKNCGAEKLRQKHIEEYPEIEQKINFTEKITAEFVKTYRAKGRNVINKSTNGEVKTIPVVVHIIYRDASENFSDAIIKRAIDSLNADFRDVNHDGWFNPSEYFLSITGDTEIEFVLASKDPNGNTTSGITRTNSPDSDFTIQNYQMFYPENGGVQNWDPYRYLNIYVCYYTDPEDPDNQPLGFAQFPDDLGNYPNEDGVVVNSAFFPIVPNENKLGRTLTHEIGHYFNLRHIWGDDECGNDLVEDTPTHFEDNQGCPTYPHNPNSSCGSDEEGEMFMNYMDYVSDNCMIMFSQGQVARMQAALENTGRRGLWDANYLSAKEKFTANEISVFPNPTTDKVNIILPFGSNIAALNAIDLLGKKYELDFSQNNNLLEVDLSDLDAGLYILSIDDNLNVWKTRIIKK